MHFRKMAGVVLFSLFSSFVMAQKDYQPTPGNLEARQWFQDAKFGMFIHWGVYSVLGDGEWVMNNQHIDKKTYEKLPAFFNPIAFDAAEWVRTAKEAGMKYITITSKHHDGFCMWNTKLTDWNIVDRTPYGKDVLKQLADECHKQGIKLFFYYSQLDWYQNNYYPRGNTGHYSGRPEKGDWYAYLDYMDGQLTELLTNYGDIAGIWFDGWWDKKDADWRLNKTYSLIHKLQPSCLIGSNHHQAPKPGEDFQMFEKDLPGHNTTGFSGESEVGQLPLETCETMNHSWGFNLQDKNYKSTKDLVHYLVKAAGYNSNFLLNVGPMPNGKIQPEFVKTLGEIGKWMDRYGKTIYGTRGGPVSPHNWGVTTVKGNKVFVHVLDLQDTNLLLPDFGKKVKKAYFFDDNTPVNFQQNKFGTTLNIPQDKRKPYDTILVMEI
ncbi:alpha-L-fucosidase [Prolixibacter denitrificans]|uniref:alpha-L-fucosidase n=2 Tax=Prolixibacter denitrificans TaxID=1541063 RepID=A0A2P8CED5_9BACT|nr:alpha-L-fucosidase [Prolixibacter denitrificans]PSK83345.1 alpha-L-fucosidase [Prolixibacter denitrificans]